MTKSNPKSEPRELWIDGDYSDAYMRNERETGDKDLCFKNYINELLESHTPEESMEIFFFELPTKIEDIDLLKKFLKKFHELKNLQINPGEKVKLEDFKQFINLFDSSDIEFSKLQSIVFEINIKDYNKDKVSFVEVMCEFLGKYEHATTVTMNFDGKLSENLLNIIPFSVEKLHLTQRYFYSAKKIQIDINISSDISFSEILNQEEIQRNALYINISKKNTPSVKLIDPIVIKVVQSKIDYYAKDVCVPFNTQQAFLTTSSTKAKAIEIQTKPNITKIISQSPQSSKKILGKRQPTSLAEQLETETETQDIKEMLKNTDKFKLDIDVTGTSIEYAD